MNPSQVPVAVRATAAALAVFMTFTMLNAVISIAEPEQSQLMAHNMPRQVAQVAAAPQHAVLVAQGPTNATQR